MRVLLCALVLAGVLAPGAARAQGPLNPYPELRADVIAARHASTTAGVGVVLPFGSYVRLGLDANGGAMWANGGSLLVGRADAIGRFLLDPFRQVPVGLSLGAGLSLPVEQHSRTVRPPLVAVVDLEGRRRGSWTPAVQLGLGGGFRFGLVLRRSAAHTR